MTNNNDFISTDYRSEADCKYFGSDLNKWVSLNCRKNIIVNNIDLVIFDYEKKRLRIIESKHSSENIGIGQGRLLRELSRLNSSNLLIDVYVIRGNPPYEMCEIINMRDSGKRIVNNDFLVRFLNFEIEFDDSQYYPLL